MTVSDQIIAVLDALCAKFGIVIDWTQDNILPYVEQLMTKIIAWEIGTSVFWMAFMSFVTLIVFIIASSIARYYKKHKNEITSYDEEPWLWLRIGAWVVFGVVSFATLCVIGKQTYDIVTCMTFPEIKVIEKIQSFISTN